MVAIAGTTGRQATATLDRAGTLPGRGAYLCRGGQSPVPSRECLLAATRKGGLARALRQAVELAPELSATESLESVEGDAAGHGVGEPIPSTSTEL